MADQPAVLFSTQLGKETVAGTGVASDKRLLSLGLGRLKPLGEGRMFTPQGWKLPTIAIPPGVRWCSAEMNGIMTYNEMIWPLLSVFKSTTPTSDGTNGKKWTFDIANNSANTRQTYTYENGNATHAQKATYAQCLSIKLTMSKQNNEITGSWLTQQLQDDITLTASPTEIIPVIINPQSFDVYIGDTQAGISGTAFTRPFTFDLSIDNIVEPLDRMASADVSFINLIEKAPTIMATFQTAADDADMAFLTNWTAGSTKFFRVKALGDVISGAIPSQYTFNLDFAAKIIKAYDPTERQGAATATWQLENAYDSTWTKSIELYVINTVAAI